MIGADWFVYVSSFVIKYKFVNFGFVKTWYSRCFGAVRLDLYLRRKRKMTRKLQFTLKEADRILVLSI